MEGHVFPDQEQLLQFLRRLKEVFDVCDEDADGFIRVEHLVDLGLQFGQGDEVKALTRHLDPNGHGKINFKDFCHGVFAIKGCEEILKMGIGSRGAPSNQPSVTDNGYFYQEQFEDYGEGEDVEFIPSSPCPEDDNRTNGFSDLGSSLPSSPNRKISSTAFGRQLFQANHSVFGSSQGSSTEDLFTDSIDSCDLDITEKVSYLEKKVTELESDSLANGDLKSKLKQENTQLVHRVHELEEQVKDAEAKADQSLEDEMKRHRELYTKMERDRNTEMDLLCNRLQQLEEENGEMKTNVCRLKSQTEKLDQEKQRMTDKLEDTSLRLKDEMDLYRKIMDKLWQNRHDFQKEKEAMQELIDDLHRELEYLQLFKLEMEHPGKGKGLSEYNAKTREIEMEHEVKRLKQENHKLRDQNDDLNAQILSLSLYEAKNLFACHTKAQCLAAEIDNASRDELVDALKEQEEINLRLRQYMDKIILAILDHNPSILEIKG
ncbi:hypothetical protein INR49_028264 [Caranx melampygus]|nr:hypothetical protein INR49_028264 [Caranx melampygus]